MKMMKILCRPFAVLMLAGALLFGFDSCSSSRKDIVPSPEYAAYVHAYTGGVISKSSTIRIELAQDQPAVDLVNPLKDNPFRFSPSLKGKTHWVNNNTLEFTPDEGQLEPGEFYEASFDLGDFVEVDKSLSKFPFSFRVQQRNFSLRCEPVTVRASSPDVVTVSGELHFSDVVKKEEVERMLKAYDADKKKLNMAVAEAGGTLVYRFTIDGVPRKADDYNVTIEVDGSSADIDRKQSEEVLIPAKGSFRLLNSRLISDPENGVEAVFSDPVSVTQDLEGLIEIAEISSTVIQVRDNRIFLFFESVRQKELTLKVHEGLTNSLGNSLNSPYSISFSEANLKPQVEIPTSAAILPDSKNLIVPFRAVGLHAVDLSVVRIFEHNVLTFMQNNSLSSAYELRRSGRLVYKKTLWLGEDTSKDLQNWEDYFIDLSGLIRQEPGAIYRVILSFRQEYSAYPCGGAVERASTFAGKKATGGLIKVADATISEEEDAVWDRPEGYFSYNPSGDVDWSLYEWEERDNPCHPTYYMRSEHIASCNVLASNLGVIVKRNTLNKVWVAVNDILTTEPVKGAKISVYNFQLQPIGEGETDADGLAEVPAKGVPFIVVAEQEKQKTYLRVPDGEEQSVSRFDVGGKESHKGLKGFIYGERGVWRPGDTLHVSFMLEDREKRIPAKHPVTLELYNPQGQFVLKQVAAHGQDGLYVFRLATLPEAPTGLWNAYVKVGGATFHKSLRIETVKPNRLKIQMNLPAAILSAQPGLGNAGISAAWLTGASAPHLQTKVEMSLSKVNTQFKNYTNYLFNNPATDFTTMNTEVFEGTLNVEGRVSFPLKLPMAADAPGMLNATLTARVFEPGGDASIYTQTVPFSPFLSYVGINLNQPKDKYIETDTDHQFDVVTLDPRGNLVNRSLLEYKIYRIDWSWWWEENRESLATYVNSTSIKPVAEGTLQTKGGKANFRFRVTYPDWGRYLVYVKDPNSGHATGGTIFVDWPESRGRSGRENPGGVKMLTFSMNKPSYEVGETATAIIPASAGGRALISLENGSTILKREWIQLKAGSDAKYSFKVTSDMAPNVYLHITMLQPHAQTVNDLPIRMYGVTPVFVTDKQTILQPQINLPEVLRPEQKFSVTVSEKNGRAMSYTLAIVDEGLLDLTNFKTPAPWNEFYAREALGIRTWDMYDNVLGARSGQYGSLFSTGGDAELKQGSAKVNRFKPVVKFIGPFRLDKGKQKTHELKLPMYVGSVRAMVVAGAEGAYGSAEKTAVVRTPLMLLSTLPRVLSTDEEITVPVNVFAMESQVKNATVTLQVSGGGVRVSGSASQSLAFARPGDQLVYFTLRTGGQTGKAVINITAQGNGQQAKETIEIEVRNPNPVVTQRKSEWVEGGQSTELAYAIEGAAPGDNVTLEVARIPSVDLSRRFDFLYDYEHHCTEQLTSKGLPLLFVSQFKDMTEQETAKIKANVQEAISRLYSRQLANGGFIYWPGHAVADEWVTSYAGMFLSLAKEKGYAVNSAVLDKWKRFQRAAAQNWRMPHEDAEWLQWQASLQQAFRLYTLALAGAPEQGAMNRMKEQQKLPLQARWRLAAAYALTGKAKPAGELVFNMPSTVDEYSSVNGVYGSSARDEAMILETLLLLNRKQDALKLASNLSRKLSAESGFSTQSTAFALMAMGRLAEELSGSLDFAWTWNGKAQPAVKSAKAVFEKQLPTSPATGTITVNNRGTGGLSVDVITRTRLRNDTLPAISRNLSLTVKYQDIKGNPVDPATIRQGADFRALVTVTNTHASGYTNLALTHIIPSGWEIHNERLNATESDQSAPYTYQDIRDDRVLTYFNLNSGESKTFAVRLQASYLGRFILPAVQCEAMYDTAAMARTQAGHTSVVR